MQEHCTAPHKSETTPKINKVYVLFIKRHSHPWNNLTNIVLEYCQSVACDRCSSFEAFSI